MIIWIKNAACNLSIFFLLDPRSCHACLVWCQDMSGLALGQAGLVATTAPAAQLNADTSQASARESEPLRNISAAPLRRGSTCSSAAEFKNVSHDHWGLFEALRPRWCKSAVKCGSKATPPTNKYMIISTNPSWNNHYYFFLFSLKCFNKHLKPQWKHSRDLTLTRSHWYFQWAVLKIYKSLALTKIDDVI